jgi:hypothetical protein
MLDTIRKLFTEPDNQTPCPVRVLTGIAALTYHAGAAAGICVGALHLDIATLGAYLQHMAMLIGVGGASVGAKSVLKGDAS